MPTKTWKSRERQGAGIFGALRNIGSGSQGRSDKSASDSTHPRLFIEQKHRQKHAPRTLHDKTKALARKEGKVPLLILTDHGRPGGLVCIHTDDLDTVLMERLVALVQGNEAIADELLGMVKEALCKTPPGSGPSSPASTPGTA